MDNSTAFFFKFIFWGLAAPFVIIYWVVKGIVYLFRMSREANEAAAAVAAQAEYELSMRPEVINHQVSAQNTLFGQQTEPAPATAPERASRSAA